MRWTTGWGQELGFSFEPCSEASKYRINPSRSHSRALVVVRGVPGESVIDAGPWTEPGSLRHPGAPAACAEDRDVGVDAATMAASLPPSPLPMRNSEVPPDRLDLTPPSSTR